MQKTWKIAIDGRTLTTQQIIDGVLKSRGVCNADEFLVPSRQNLIPFEKLSHISDAQQTISNCISNNKNIFIYGDVDTDGCTSASIIYRYLKNFTDNITVYINSGKTHGVDENFDFDRLKYIDTMIIVDSIDDDMLMYEKILSQGIKLIILDHHVPCQEVLDNQDRICLVSSAIGNYPNPHLSGAGVCWKFVSYLDAVFHTSFAEGLVDLACVGLIADVSDVSTSSLENRYICNLGLNNITNPAVKILSGGYEFTAQTISFGIAPLINSANRMCHNDESLRLFLSDDLTEISQIISNLKSYKEEQNIIVEELYSRVIQKQSKNQLNRKCMMFCLSEAKNFLGLIASRACAEFQRPIIVISEGDTSYDGSMRAVGLDDFRTVINNTGLAVCAGHELSAGITIPKENLIPFCNQLEVSLQDYTFEQKTAVDVLLTKPQINSYLIRKFKDFNKISGCGFPQITVCIENITGYRVLSLSNGKHLKVVDNDLSLIKWNFTDWDSMKNSKILSVVGTLDENNFRGTCSNQIILSDYKYE